MYRREHAPEGLPDFARRAEAVGFDELWVVEDCFYGSGIASAAVALACTDSITVGLGIMPAVARNPVFTAMEIATLSRLYPGRFLPGLGYGVAGWMRQIGAFPRSQLKALEEAAITIGRILSGEPFSFEGTHIQLDQVELVHSPEQAPPISLGVRGPKSLVLSGQVADGTILAEYAAPAYITRAREQIAAGQQAAGGTREYRLTVFSLACADTATIPAYSQFRPLVAAAIASGKLEAQLAPLGILPQVHELLNDGGHAHLEAEMPEAWLDQLGVVGSPQAWHTAIERLVAAGANSVVLVPLPGKGADQVELFADHLASVA